MSIWKHKDARASSIGCLGIVCLIIAGIFILQASIQNESITNLTWIIAISGILILGFFMAMLKQAEKRIKTYQKKRNDRANEIRDEVLNDKNPSKPYFVYLRPFDIDEKFVYPPETGAGEKYVEEYGMPKNYHDLESALALLVYPHGELVALSKKEGKAGAGHVKSTDDSWENDVHKLCRFAEGIFIVPFSYEGTAWEVEMLVENNYLKKTFFVMPSKSIIFRLFGSKRLSRDYKELWESGRSRYGELGLELPKYDTHGGVVPFNNKNQILKVFGHKFMDTSRSKQDILTLQELIKKLADDNAKN